MNPHKKTVFILFPLIVILSFAGIYLTNVRKDACTNTPGIVNEGTIPINLTREIAGYVKNKDFTSLSNFVDEESGLLLLPYYTYGDNQGRKLTKEEVKNFFMDTQEKMWGYQDGSGQEMFFTNIKYYEKYIYSYDFLRLGKESLNTSLVNGNTLPLDQVLSEIFKLQISQGKKIQYIEYYISGFDPKYEGMDWESLALIFLNIKRQWKLVSIMHNQWTI